MWRCGTCGSIYKGKVPLISCPVCGTSGDDFEEMSGELSPLEECIGIFSCPLCQQAFALEGKSLQCKNNHTYDIARAGYVNMLSRSAKDDYNREMLASRRYATEKGLYNPVFERVKELLPNKGYLLDAGCGEGTPLSHIAEESGLLGVGIDLSKDGIQLAAHQHKKQCWVVGDLAAMPFRANVFSSVLNMLSPANYDEFRRVLKSGGNLLKIIPDAGYLKELRELFYQGAEQEEYSNDQIIKLFKQNFPRCRQERVEYQFALTDDLIPHICAMSPLLWNISPEVKKKLTLEQFSSLTIDVTILTAEME